MQNNNLPSGQLTALNNMPVVDRLADIKKHQTIGLIVILSFFGVFGIWASLAPLDEAVVAAGRVIVETNRKTVQHLEGGIVDEILVKNGDKWDIYEVKSSTSLKDYHLDDAAVQYYAIKDVIPVNKVYIIHIDNTYERNGELEIDKLFKISMYCDRSVV